MHNLTDALAYGMNSAHTKTNLSRSFLNACKNDDVGAVEDMMRKFRNDQSMHKYWYSDIDLDVNAYMNEYNLFIVACGVPSLAVAVWLYNTFDMSRRINFEHTFKCVFECAPTNDATLLEIIKWLHSLNVFDMHINDDSIFRSACEYGHTNVAAWIYSLGDVDIHACDENALGITNPHDICTLEFLLENGADLHAHNNIILKKILEENDGMEITRLLLDYCDESDYCLFDSSNLRAILNPTKKAQ